MKKVIMYGMLISITVFLSACVSSDFKKSMEDGQEAIDSANFEIAMTHFMKAIELEPAENEARLKLNEARTAQFDLLYNSGVEALEKKAFAEAITLLDSAYALDKTTKPDILDKKMEAQESEKKQKELTAYGKWLSEAAKLNNVLANDWRTSSSNLSIGAININEFKEKMRTSLTSYQKLLESAEKEILTISGDLSVAHTTYLNKIQSNYEQLRLIILETNNKEMKIENILTLGKDLNDILKQQALHIQSLNTYASTNNLIFAQ